MKYTNSLPGQRYEQVVECHYDGSDIPERIACLFIDGDSARSVKLEAKLQIHPVDLKKTGYFNISGRWYEWNGASYCAIGCQLISNPDCYVFYDAEAGSHFSTSGKIFSDIILETRSGLNNPRFGFYVTSECSQSLQVLGTLAVTIIE
jgi:hypothetical protein